MEQPVELAVVLGPVAGEMETRHAITPDTLAALLKAIQYGPG